AQFLPRAPAPTRSREAVGDRAAHHLLGVVHKRVRAGAVVVTGRLVIGRIGAARGRRVHYDAHDAGGGEDRVGEVEGVGAAVAAPVDPVGLPDGRTRPWAAGAFADDRDLHRPATARRVHLRASAGAALLRPDRGDEGPVDVKAPARSLVERKTARRYLPF